MQQITSKDNEQIKHIRRLKEKKYREESNEFIIEGIKLIKEAIIEKQKIKTIVICDGCDKDSNFDSKILYEIAKMNCIVVPEKIFKTLTEVTNPQGILAVIEKQNKENKIDYKADIILILDNIQDPGNLGTILRTADSINLKQIIISKGTVDSYSSKVIRSTMGAIFRINIIDVESLEETIKEIKKHKFKIVVSSLQTENTIYDINYYKKVIIIGNEANGVEQQIQEIADEKIKIPMIRKNRKLKCISSNRNYFV